MRSRIVVSTVLSAAALTGVTAGLAHANTATPGYTPITAPTGAAQWGSTSAAQSSTGSTNTYDNEVHSGAASNFGQEVTNYGSSGTNYSNQASSSNTAGGSATQSSATAGPTYGSYDSYDLYGSYGPSSSGQSTTVGGHVNNFANSSSSGSSVVGGFVAQGVTGSSYGY